MTTNGLNEARPLTHRAVTGGGHKTLRHFWVTVTGITDDKHPGVLMGWRRDDRGVWEALVFWASGGGRHAPHRRLDWLSAHRVEPRI